MWNPGQIGKCTISTKLPLLNPYRCLKNITVPSYLTIPLYTTLPYMILKYPHRNTLDCACVIGE